ncbi:helix-turn-helix transcriptional regulator [Marinimicrobium agarilyticum]|uniref:helix-turn-helix transcriptional regulator n=1 Tax=Marinimicrobium agarilyticum TaxID=306546 RepID=UPI0004058F9D|nr:helix-turn-helix transcriptional regulator [Marinimicrobium agarilyticum]
MRPDPLTAPALLDTLYEGAMNPARWPEFLTQLAALFHTGTATLRVADRSAPSVLQSYTVGFDRDANQRYLREGVEEDPFRKALEDAPLGKIQLSHDIIADQAFERSEHYQQVFRPSGNFYAMGGHFERRSRKAVYVGVHRPRAGGPFSEQERQCLEFFPPHLRRAVRLMGMLHQMEEALQRARAALDQLPFGVWFVDQRLRCDWVNHPAEEAMRTGAFGLTLHFDRLMLTDLVEAKRLTSAVNAIARGISQVETVRLGLTGASLLLVAQEGLPTAHLLGGLQHQGVLIVLLDPERPLTPDTERLRTLYGLTPAEIRLLTQLFCGRDLQEASGALSISIHTARCQLKTAMQKTGVSRQTELLRKLIVTTASFTLRTP